MNTIKKKITVYIDAMAMETSDSAPCVIAQAVLGDYIPSTIDGYLRNKVEIEVSFPVKNPIVVLPDAKADVLM